MRFAGQSEMLNACEVHINDIGEVINWRHGMFGRCCAGVGDDNVESPEGFQRLRNKGNDIGAIGDISSNSNGRSAGCRDFVANRIDLILASSRDHNLSARVGIGKSNCPADSAARAGHDRDLTSKRCRLFSSHLFLPKPVSSR